MGWITVRLRKTDVDYILRHCQFRKECVPTLQKRGKCWYLDFPFQQEGKLHNTEIFNQTIVAVDLGMNSCCVCSVMRPDGTILGRRFLRLPREYDSLTRKVSHIKYAQRHGSRSVRRLWKLADGVNDDIAVKTAQFILDTAVLYSADTIVFEHLDLSGRKRGSKRQSLHLWKARRVQAIVSDKAHAPSMRISRINAWGTSRLAFGRLRAGSCAAGSLPRQMGIAACVSFRQARLYNCDLNTPATISGHDILCVRS